MTKRLHVRVLGLVLVGAAASGAVALTGTDLVTPTGGDPGELRPTGAIVGSDPIAARAEALSFAAAGRGGVDPNSIKLAINASSTTAGLSLWAYDTTSGREQLLVESSGAPYMWVGCPSLARGESIRICGSGRESAKVVLTGVAAPEAVRVHALLAGGTRRIVDAKAGQWLLVIPATVNPGGGYPVRLEATTAAGGVVEVINTRDGPPLN